MSSDKTREELIADVKSYYSGRYSRHLLKAVFLLLECQTVDEDTSPRTLILLKAAKAIGLVMYAEHLSQLKVEDIGELHIALTRSWAESGTGLKGIFAYGITGEAKPVRRDVIERAEKSGICLIEFGKLVDIVCSDSIDSRASERFVSAILNAKGILDSK